FLRQIVAGGGGDGKLRERARRDAAGRALDGDAGNFVVHSFELADQVLRHKPLKTAKPLGCRVANFPRVSHGYVFDRQQPRYRKRVEVLAYQVELLAGQRTGGTLTDEPVPRPSR